MDMENIKKAVKQSIVQNFMAEAKHTPRGASHQRPKSWDKGTKSGSEKRKMREQGKREAREMNEDRNWLYAAHDALQGYISPADVTTHFRNKEFSSPEHFRSALQQLTDDHADRFISTQAREGADPEKAMRSFSDRIMGKFDTRLQELQAAEARNQAQIAQGKSRRQYDDDGTDAARDQRAIDEFEGRRGRGSWQDYYDQPRHWRESVEHTLRSRLMETGSWGPEMAGASQDDATAAAYEEQSREESMAKKMSHADVIEKLNQAHESALSRIATAYGKGGKHYGKDPYYMLGHYMEHLEDLHDPIRSDLT